MRRDRTVFRSRVLLCIPRCCCGASRTQSLRRRKKEREKEIVYRLMSCSSADPLSELHVISSLILFTYSLFTLSPRMAFPSPHYLLPSRLFCFAKLSYFPFGLRISSWTGRGIPRNGNQVRVVSGRRRRRSHMLRGTGIRSALQFNSSGCVMDDRQAVTSA